MTSEAAERTFGAITSSTESADVNALRFHVWVLRVCCFCWFFFLNQKDSHA